MNTLRKLVARGHAIMNEWHNNENIDNSSRRMIAELTAVILMDVCGGSLKGMSRQECENKTHAIRIALTTAFQIGKCSRTANLSMKKEA